MNTKAFFFLVVALTASLAITPPTAVASEKPEDVSEAEWAMLPPYCPHTMGYKGHVQPYISKWRSAMGEGFFHMHHHCWALIDFHRAQRSGMPEAERQQLRQRALGGFRYVIKNAPEDFILLPEIYTWVGRSEMLLRNGKGAARAFNQAIGIKPDYWPAYYHFAELLNRKGQRKEAFDVAKRGLSHSPEARPLLLLFGELGGRPNDIPKLVENPEEHSDTETEAEAEVATPTTESTKELSDKSVNEQLEEPRAN